MKTTLLVVLVSIACNRLALGDTIESENAMLTLDQVKEFAKHPSAEKLLPVTFSWMTTSIMETDRLSKHLRHVATDEYLKVITNHPDKWRRNAAKTLTSRPSKTLARGSFLLNLIYVGCQFFTNTNESDVTYDAATQKALPLQRKKDARILQPLTD